MSITAEEVRRLGYEVTRASACEVGLVKNGKGIRTWWCADFDRRLPGLDHPTILRAVALVEASGLS